jgi:hypothetical protein
MTPALVAKLCWAADSFGWTCWALTIYLCALILGGSHTVAVKQED